MTMGNFFGKALRGMGRFVEPLRLRREERWPAAVALVVIVALNALMVAKYYDLFVGRTHGGYWQLFIGKFHVSGYDPMIYLVMSVWQAFFNSFRHPLLLWMLYPAARLNGWLMEALGMNCAQFITAAALTVADFTSFVLLFRLLRRVVGVGRADTSLLCALFFGFAYVMVAMVVPDHFAFSMCLLLLVLYVAGRRLRGRRPMPGWLSAALFVLTAGLTLSNGVKVFLAQWLVNGRRFFAWRNLLCAVAVPAALMLCVSFSVGGIPRHTTDAELAESNRMLAEKGMPTHVNREGEPMGETGFLNWTDVSTSRWDVAVENLFGESLQLHRDHLLGDIWIDRPVLVRYRLAANYVVEALLVLLFAVGVWCGRRDRFLWLVMSWFAFDMLLSMVLGFGISEIYIFAPHWLFAMPLAVGYLFKSVAGRRLVALRCAMLCLAVWLWAYNGSLFVGFLLGG